VDVVVYAHMCWLEKNCGVGDNATPGPTDLNDVHVVASEVYLPMKGCPFLNELHARPSPVRIVSEFRCIAARALRLLPTRTSTAAW
jgi:hypothetical protein